MKKIIFILFPILILVIAYFAFSYLGIFGLGKSYTDDAGRYVGPGCKISSGCNGAIHCVSNKKSSQGGSVCVALAEFSCYFESGMRCEKQSNGSCGWTSTEELSMCIQEKRELQKNSF